MTKPDFRGARGANAGDSFHELWALRNALNLLDPHTDLTAITVEGLRAEDENGMPTDTWDGVDCAFYYGGDSADDAERIVIDQLKYSAAQPDKPWTIARLTSSNNGKRDNSVIGRLAKVFTGLKENFHDVASADRLKIRLISNQPVDSAALTVFSAGPIADSAPAKRLKKSPDRSKLIKASRLSENEYDAFIACLDFSECGADTRFSLDLQILATIADWTDDDSRSAKNDLLDFIRRAMLPEGKGKYITRQSILAQLGVSDPGALFPCPSNIKRVEQLVPRAPSQTIVQQMLDGRQRICLYGEGGCGKTTALQEIESMLPTGSVLIAYDCYGGGAECLAGSQFSSHESRAG